MRKYIWLLLIIVGAQYIVPLQSIYAQKKGHIEGTILLNKNVTVQINNDLVNYLTANLTNIESINGQTIINIPIEREYKKNRRSRIIEGYFCQYEWTIFPDGDDVTIDNIKTTYLEFDFDKDKITEKHKDDDDGMFDKPSDLKEKIKIKDKKPKRNK